MPELLPLWEPNLVIGSAKSVLVVAALSEVKSLLDFPVDLQRKSDILLEEPVWSTSVWARRVAAGENTNAKKRQGFLTR